MTWSTPKDPSNQNNKLIPQSATNMLQTLSFVFLSLPIPTLQKLCFQYFTKSSRCLSPAKYVSAHTCHCIAPYPTNVASEWSHHPALYSVCTCSTPSNQTNSTFFIIIPSLQVINSLKPSISSPLVAFGLENCSPLKSSKLQPIFVIIIDWCPHLPAQDCVTNRQDVSFTPGMWKTGCAPSNLSYFLLFSSLLPSSFSSLLGLHSHNLSCSW